MLCRTGNEFCKQELVKKQLFKKSTDAITDEGIIINKSNNFRHP
jgi:hypothetical protein